jgi:aspartyl-tRNA(Asn)/glutamyl-tRNA(Gln) amidotransferase subunit C
MEKITKKQIEDLAKLARIGISESEKTSLSSDMNAILEYVKQLEEVDTSDFEPTSQVTGLANITREDGIIKNELTRDELLCNTPDTEDWFIKVKTVL